MTSLSQKILEKYQVRKTKAQKTRFINLLKNELGRDITIENDGKIMSTRNIVIGDIHKAEFVVGAHYDTQPVMPVPNFLAPKNILRFIGYSLFTVAVLSVFFILGCNLLFWLIPNDLLAAISNVVFISGSLLMILFGPANKHTANDNTSGVITLLELAQDDSIGDKIAFVLFDREETGLWGSNHFAKRHKDVMKTKLLLNLDCVSDGDHIMLAVSKTARNNWGEKIEQSFVSKGEKQVFITNSEKTIYPSDQMNFKCHIGVAAFKKNKFIGYYMDRIHTSKDTVFDVRNIEFILDGIKKLAQL